MTILLTGSAGKIARRTASQLSLLPNPPPILRTSRSPPADSRDTIAFNWSDQSTFTHPFTHPLHATSPITAVLLILPPDLNPDASIYAFARLAISHGVSTFVLLSSAVCDPDPESPTPHGRIHAGLLFLAARTPGVVVHVLRPAFFMQNFAEQERHVASIRGDGCVYSAAGDGREAFVCAEDIAAVAAKCLIGELREAKEQGIRIVGPQALSYGDVAAVLGEVTGREIGHLGLGREAYVRRQVEGGMGQMYAEMMAGLDERIAGGLGEGPEGDVEEVLGRKAVGFREFAERNREVWM